MHVLRRHPITFVPSILLFLLLLTVPSVVGFLLETADPDIMTNNNSRALVVLGASFYYLAIFAFIYARFIDYYLDLWVITNDRIVDVNQEGLFARTIAELDLYKVQDVTSNIKGFFHTFLNFGDLHIQTAGERSRFHFKNVRDPHALRKEIQELVRVDRKHHHAEVLD